MHTIDKLALENCTKNFENILFLEFWAKISGRKFWGNFYTCIIFPSQYMKQVKCAIFFRISLGFIEIFREWVNSYRNVYTLLPLSSVIHVSNGKCNACLVILHELADGAPSSIVSNEFLLCIRAVSFVSRLSIDIVTCYYRLRGV